MNLISEYVFFLLASNVSLAFCLIQPNSLHMTPSTYLETSKSEIATGFRATQTRKKHATRKPAGYWKDTKNIEHEIRSQWKSVSVNIPSNVPPPIPNETLLNYWGRNDLRYAISQIGGRDILSAEMNYAFIIPGKWKEASKTAWVREAIRNDKNLDPDLPPLSPQQAKRTRDSSRTNEIRKNVQWTHQSERRNKGFWRSEEVVIEELYLYLRNRRDARGLPAVWMPRGNELNDAGRNDLHQAIYRYGGSKSICKKAGLIPSREWHYMEGLYELMLELKAYCDEYFNGDYSRFPTVYTLDEQGYGRLKTLIAYFGGQKFVAERFGMVHNSLKRHGPVNEIDFLSWGKFDLQFGIDLLEFVRNENMRKNPPVQYPFIAMPTFRDLLQSDDEGAAKLDVKINEYGGYENVARRLGLAFAPNRT